MRRSFFVVSAFMIGGWMIGTSAMYEYAATAIAPRRFGARREVSQIAVGPSAPPMMPIEAAAQSGSQPKKSAPKIAARPSEPKSAKKIPNCAAPPRSAIFGFAISGPKSVIAPTPMKIMIGKTPVSMPNLKK